MYIAGLQKLTLLDYPGHLAAVLFLDGCNFRCPFCHNRDLVLHPGPLPAEAEDGCSPENAENQYPEEEILKFLKKRAGMLDGVCISGGEPTLHRELPDLISHIRELGYKVKLDTNGTNPDMLRELLGRNLLDYIAMDIKAGRRNYETVAGIKKISPAGDPGGSGLGPGSSLLSGIQRSIGLIKSSGIDYEFRTTAVKGLHTEEDFEDIAQWLSEEDPKSGCSSRNLSGEHTRSPGLLHYYLQSFRDCDTILLPDHNFSAFTREEMLRFLSIVKKTIPAASLRGMEP